MKSIVITVFMVIALFCALVGCKPVASPIDDTQSSAATISSETEVVSVPVSENVTSSNAGDDLARPVSPPPKPIFNESEQSAEDKAFAELEKENERLSKLTTEYTAQLEQEIYLVGTETIKLLIKNKGPGILFREYNSGQAIQKFDEIDWVSVEISMPPQTNGPDWIFPNTDSVKEYRIGKLTEAGLYRACELFSYADVREEETFEFTLE
ncbi:MAG: hypothetical protein RR444_00350 [Oscillospiraceae bacterium]